MIVMPRRLSDEVASRVRALIEEQQLEAGMKLPAERQLARTARRIAQLAARGAGETGERGVLISRRGGGTFIRWQHEAWSEQNIVQPLKTLLADDPDYSFDILEARHAIEASTAACSYACHCCRQTEDQTLFRGPQSEDPDLASQADVRFHLAIAEASHNVVLLQTMRGFFDVLQSSVKQSRQRMYLVPPVFSQLTAQHQAVPDAIVAGDADGARKAMMAHLGFVHTTIKRFDEDQARRCVSPACPVTPVRIAGEQHMIISAASDYRAAAQRILPPFLFHYIDGGAYAEHTLRRNVADLSEVALRQRVLKNMSDLSTETKLFNETLSPCRWPLHLSVCAACTRAGAKFRPPPPLMPKAFRLRFPRYPYVRLKKSPQPSNVRCGSSYMFCAIVALCATRWNAPKRRAALRWSLPSICQPGARYRDAHSG